MRSVMVASMLAAAASIVDARPLWEQPDGPAYPDELADRPLLLLTGMTEVSVGTALHDHDVARLVADTPDVSVRHAFGPIEIDASFGPGAALSLAIPTGRFPDAIIISARTTAQAPDKTMFVSQSLLAAHKLVAVPHQLAFEVGVGGSYDEERIHAPGLQWVRVAGVGITTQIDIQLASTLALYTGASIGYPLSASSHLDFQASFGAKAGIALTIANSWDLYTAGTLADDNDTAVVALGVGVDKRFGP